MVRARKAKEEQVKKTLESGARQKEYMNEFISTMERIQLERVENRREKAGLPPLPVKQKEKKLDPGLYQETPGGPGSMEHLEALAKKAPRGEIPAPQTKKAPARRKAQGPRPKAKGSGKRSQVMKEAQRLKKEGVPQAEALKQAWAKYK